MWVRIIEFGRDNTPRYQYGINTSDIGDKSRCDQRKVIWSGNICDNLLRNVPLNELGAKAETDDTKSETRMTDFTMVI